MFYPVFPSYIRTYKAFGVNGHLPGICGKYGSVEKPSSGVSGVFDLYSDDYDFFKKMQKASILKGVADGLHFFNYLYFII